MGDEGEALLGARGAPGLTRNLSVDMLWVPVTLHLPLGLAKSWTPNCAEFSVYTPLLAIIFFAQLANTVLVPVLPFMVTQMGADPIYYGLLQSAFWTVELVSAPILGSLSDRVGRRVVICSALVVSASSHAVLAIAPDIYTMLLARVLSGFGFQLALCRAYFAEVGTKQNRASSFGLIGVITGVALTMGPTLGGIVGGSGKPHQSAWFACGLCAIAAAFALRWRPLEPVEKLVTRSDQKRWVRIDLRAGGKDSAGGKEAAREGAAQLEEGHPLPLTPRRLSDRESEAVGEGGDGDADEPRLHQPPVLLRRSRLLCKVWRLNGWLLAQGVYPLLLLNTSFRFAFSVYKSSFAFFCMHSFGWGASEVGIALSLMGLLGIFVQGVLLRVVVGCTSDGFTLYLGLLATSLGLMILAAAQSTHVLAVGLGMITVGYGLAVPSLSALFSHVPMQQGVMQGIAGSADRFGQAIGPIAGMKLLGVVGERGLMHYTGIGLFLVCTACVQFIRGSDGNAISTALVRGVWAQALQLRLHLGGGAGASEETASLIAADLACGERGRLLACSGSGSSSSSSSSARDSRDGLVGALGAARDVRAYDEPRTLSSYHSDHSDGLSARHPNREGLEQMSRERSIHGRLHAEGGAGAPSASPPGRVRSGSIVISNGTLARAEVPHSPFNTEEAERIRMLRERSHSF